MVLVNFWSYANGIGETPIQCLWSSYDAWSTLNLDLWEVSFGGDLSSSTVFMNYEQVFCSKCCSRNNLGSRLSLVEVILFLPS